MIKMKIVFVAYTDPRDATYGGEQRTHVIWKGLRSIPGSMVRVIVPVPHKALEKDSPEDGIAHVCFERRYSIGWFLQRVLKKFIPYWDSSWAYDWRGMHRICADADVVVARYIKSAAAFRMWEIAPLYIDADDIHTLEFDAETRVMGNNPWRAFLRFILGLYQNAIYKKAHCIWLPALDQVKLLKGLPTSWLPNIPCGHFPDLSNVPSDINRLFFVGLMASSPNFMAIDLFLRKHWDLLKKEFPLLTLDVAGSGLPSRFARDWRQYLGVNLLGYVPDIGRCYRRSGALLTPMVMGMGTCIKVFESLRMGRPVISTSQGLRGIPMEKRVPANGIFQYDSHESLVAAIHTLQSISESERIKMAKAGMELVEESYSQRVVNQILQNAFAESGK